MEETEGSGSSKFGSDLMANANVRFKFGELSSKFGLFGWESTGLKYCKKIDVQVKKFHMYRFLPSSYFEIFGVRPNTSS